MADGGFTKLQAIEQLSKRWAKADLHTLAPDGGKRVLRVLEAWGIEGPESS